MEIMEDIAGIDDQNKVNDIIRNLVSQTDALIDDIEREDITDIVLALKHNLICSNLKVKALLEGAENSQKYIDRYFAILNTVLSNEELKIRELKDLIFSF